MTDCKKTSKTKKFEKFTDELSDEYVKELRKLCKYKENEYKKIRKTFKTNLKKTMNTICVLNKGNAESKKVLNELLLTNKTKKNMIKNIKKNLKNLNKSNQVCPVWDDQLKKRKTRKKK